jgi:hypothetical protein
MPDVFDYLVIFLFNEYICSYEEDNKVEKNKNKEKTKRKVVRGLYISSHLLVPVDEFHQDDFG